MPTAPGAISRVIHTCAWCGREGTRGFGLCDDGRTRCSALTACNRRVERFREHTYREGADTRSERKGEK